MHSETELLAYMSTYWKDFRGNDDSLWAHEWNKHGTCMSSLETNCYSDYQPQEEVRDYFVKAVELFKGLDTYQVRPKRVSIPSNTA
jgi:ribonuclease T2